MRILMLGNSFIFTNDLPAMLAESLGAEVISHTRGGARLAEQINPKTRMGASTLRALAEEKWDYVILQEMSNAPATTTAKFLETAGKLCTLIRENGAKPVFYATWAYKNGSEKMKAMPFSYEEMYRKMYEAYHQAAEQNDALIADVGKVFFERAQSVDLYAADGCHPNIEGTRLAAQVIAETILKDWKDR